MPQIIVLPVIKDEDFVMIRVKRTTIGDITPELPAGAIEQGKLPVQGAAREFAEDTGVVLP